MKWLDGDGGSSASEIMFDVIPAKKIVSDEVVLDLSEGSRAEAPFEGKLYSVKILAKGM